MGFGDIPGNDYAKRIIINELKKKKRSGTYLFSGAKGINIVEFALGFAKALNCLNKKDDFCDYCSNCTRINKLVYPNLEIAETEGDSIKVEKIREVIKNSASSGYEEGKKVFIIKNVEKLRKESANALLKTVEEPSDNTFFILTANSMDVLPTIISRSVVVDFYPEGFEKLGIDEKVFKFFDGNTEDCFAMKGKYYNFEDSVEYTEIGNKLKKYIELREIEIKADIIKCIDDFVKKVKFLTELEKITFGEIIEKSIGNDRKFLREVLGIFIRKSGISKKTEKLLEIKENLNYNISISNVLYIFFLEI